VDAGAPEENRSKQLQDVSGPAIPLPVMLNFVDDRHPDVRNAREHVCRYDDVRLLEERDRKWNPAVRRHDDAHVSDGSQSDRPTEEATNANEIPRGA
jgi:hypothetical protein